MPKITALVIATAIILTLSLANAIFQPFLELPQPARFDCLPIETGKGEWFQLPAKPESVFGLGLSYANHIRESAGIYQPGKAPPVFIKSHGSLNTGDAVHMPDKQELVQQLASMDEGFAKQVSEQFEHLPPLLDYEVEMGMVLMEDLDSSRMGDPDYVPRLGFFVANDMTARTLILANKNADSLDAYLGLAKSLPGFLPVNKQVWVPNIATARSLPCVELTTLVNGEVRQAQRTTDLIYTPREMLQFVVDRYPEIALKQGDMVITGTPSGIALQVPAWKQRLGQLLGFDRERKMEIVIGANADNPRFLAVGDVVTVAAEGLGEKTIVVR